MHRLLVPPIRRRTPREIASPGSALTTLDRRAIRSAWSSALCHGLCIAMMLATIVVAPATALLLPAGVAALILMILLPRHARTCRHYSARRIFRADLIAADRLLPYAEYRQWLASLPEPGRLWRALGAPTPAQRLDCLQHVRTRLPALQNPGKARR